MPVLLPTDALIWLLVAAVAAFAWYSSRQAHLAAPWARVFRSRIAVRSAVVLACFLVVGLLDSLHYRPRLPAQSPDAPVAYSVQVRAWRRPTPRRSRRASSKRRTSSSRTAHWCENSRAWRTAEPI